MISSFQSVTTDYSNFSSTLVHSRDLKDRGNLKIVFFKHQTEQPVPDSIRALPANHSRSGSSVVHERAHCSPPRLPRLTKRSRGVSSIHVEMKLEGERNKCFFFSPVCDERGARVRVCARACACVSVYLSVVFFALFVCGVESFIYWVTLPF